MTLVAGVSAMEYSKRRKMVYSTRSVEFYRQCIVTKSKITGVHDRIDPVRCTPELVFFIFLPK